GQHPVRAQCRICVGGDAMIYRLQRKFVLISTVSVLAVIVLVFAAILLFVSISPFKYFSN
ncbi:MAG: hypothetical protein IKZ15_04115, partial [Clostridia bacterium]|nr:hypothetical protein [Clostridia bacterium]